MSPRPLLLILAAALTHGEAAQAHDPVPVYDRVHLSASAGRDVDTDTLVAILYKEHQSAQQATAADEVNRDVRWAVDLAKSRKVEVATAAYRTQPVYQKQHIAGWRVYQSIRLRSGDAAALAALLGDLQERLSIQSLQNALSPEGRAAAEEQLIVEALEAYSARAATIAAALGRPGHRIVDINVDAGGHSPPVPMAVSAVRSAESSVAVAPPAVEGGTLRVEVRVSGTIELTPAGP